MACLTLYMFWYLTFFKIIDTMTFLKQEAPLSFWTLCFKPISKSCHSEVGWKIEFLHDWQAVARWKISRHFQYRGVCWQVSPHMVWLSFVWEYLLAWALACFVSAMGQDGTHRLDKAICWTTHYKVGTCTCLVLMKIIYVIHCILIWIAEWWKSPKSANLNPQTLPINSHYFIYQII